MSTVWWIAAGTLLALEMLSGTFYLLMLALGLAAAALSAHAGWVLSLQITTAAVVGLMAVLLWHLRRRMSPPPQAQDNNLDIGGEVQVDAWQADGQARVHYRGAAWTAVLQPGLPAAPGRYRVTALDGSRLVVEPVSA